MDPQDDENLLKVKSVLRGSPASGCGVIAVGDVIVAVDGEDMYGSSLAGVRQDPRYTINSSQHGLRE
jgi:C-terminal processing protease CtpA/Prc